jgi:hypothetical protein
MTTKPKTRYPDILEFSEGYLIDLEEAAARGDPKAAEKAMIIRAILASPAARYQLLEGGTRILEAAARSETPKQYNKVRPLKDFDTRDEWGHA